MLPLGLGIAVAVRWAQIWCSGTGTACCMCSPDWPLLLRVHLHGLGQPGAFSPLTSGPTCRTANEVGAGRPKEARHAAAVAVRLASLLGLFLGITILFTRCLPPLPLQPLCPVKCRSSMLSRASASVKCHSAASMHFQPCTMGHQCVRCCCCCCSWSACTSCRADRLVQTSPMLICPARRTKLVLVFTGEPDLISVAAGVLSIMCGYIALDGVQVCDQLKCGLACCLTCKGHAPGICCTGLVESGRSLPPVAATPAMAQQSSPLLCAASGQCAVLHGRDWRSAAACGLLPPALRALCRSAVECSSPENRHARPPPHASEAATAVQTVLGGILRGTARQAYAAPVIVFSYFIVALPTSLLLCFVFKFGVRPTFPPLDRAP